MIKNFSSDFKQFRGFDFGDVFKDNRSFGGLYFLDDLRAISTNYGRSTRTRKVFVLQALKYLRCFRLATFWHDYHLHHSFYIDPEMSTKANPRFYLWQTKQDPPFKCHECNCWVAVPKWP